MKGPCHFQPPSPSFTNLFKKSNPRPLWSTACRDLLEFGAGVDSNGNIFVGKRDLPFFNSMFFLLLAWNMLKYMYIYISICNPYVHIPLLQMLPPHPPERLGGGYSISTNTSVWALSHAIEKVHTMKKFTISLHVDMLPFQVTPAATMGESQSAIESKGSGLV